MSYKNYDKIIFVHIPRTGGNSIRESIGRDLDINNFFFDHKPVSFHNPTKNSFTFSFVRNPYDIVRSFYDYTFHALNHRSMRKYSFKEWIRSDFDCHWRYQDGYPNNPIDQSSYILNDRNEILVDFLGRHENLSADFNKVVALLGLKRRRIQYWSGNDRGFSKIYDIFKRYNRKGFVDYYDEESIKMVNDKLSRDFEVFGYKKL